jgi:hypothetical protein
MDLAGLPLSFIGVAWGPGIACLVLPDVFCIAREDRSYLRMFTMITNMDFKARYNMMHWVSGIELARLQ